MPIFEYVCQGCGHAFEAIVLGSQKAECPKCHAKKLQQKLSAFAVGGKAGSALPCEAGGSCSMDNGGGCDMGGCGCGH